MAHKKVTSNTTVCVLLLLLLIRGGRQKVAGEGVDPPYPWIHESGGSERSEVCVTGRLQDSHRTVTGQSQDNHQTPQLLLQDFPTLLQLTNPG